MPVGSGWRSCEHFHHRPLDFDRFSAIAPARAEVHRELNEVITSPGRRYANL
jgi:hypothetical protein